MLYCIAFLSSKKGSGFGHLPKFRQNTANYFYLFLLHDNFLCFLTKAFSEKSILCFAKFHLLVTSQTALTVLIAVLLVWNADFCIKGRLLGFLLGLL